MIKKPNLIKAISGASIYQWFKTITLTGLGTYFVSQSDNVYENLVNKPAREEIAISAQVEMEKLAVEKEQTRLMVENGYELTIEPTEEGEKRTWTKAVTVRTVVGKPSLDELAHEQGFVKYTDANGEPAYRQYVAGKTASEESKTR